MPGADTIAFWYWFLAGTKPFLIFLFFRNDPKLGTLASGAMTTTFVILLSALMLAGQVRSPARREWPPAAKWIAIYIIWVGVTLSWTHAESRFIAFAYWLTMAFDVLFVFMLLRIGEIERVSVRSLKGLVCGATVLGIVTLLFGGTGAYGRLGDEEFLHPNTVGNIAAIAGIGSIYLARHTKEYQRLLWMAVLSFLVFILMASLSKTAIFAFLMAIGVNLVVGRYGLIGKVALVGLVAAVVAVTYGPLVSYMEEYAYAAGGENLLTLSGRTVIWTETWDMIVENWLFGYGFMSFRDVGPQIAEVRLVHAHNEWLHLWFTVGGIGSLVAGLIYVSYFGEVRRSSLKTTRLSSQSVFGLSLGIYALVRGVTEAHVTGLVFPLPLVLLISAWLCRAVKQDDVMPFAKYASSRLDNKRI